MGYRRKTHAVSLCKSIMSSIQWFQIHHIITFSTIYNKAVGHSGARVSPFHTLVPQLSNLCFTIFTLQLNSLVEKERKTCVWDSRIFSDLYLKSIMFDELFELWLSGPVNSYGHAGTLPPFHGTCSQK